MRVAVSCAAQRAARIGLLLLGISQEVAKKETKGTPLGTPAARHGKINFA